MQTASALTHAAAIDWGLTGTIIVSGIIVVFIVLILLIALIVLMGKIITGIVNSRKDNNPAPPVAQPLSVVSAPAPAVAPTPINGVSGETVAAISAAVHLCMSDTAPGTPYVITNISPRSNRPQGSRPVWGFAGMRQNTEPF